MLNAPTRTWVSFMDTKMKVIALWSLLTPQCVKWRAFTHLGKCVILGKSHSQYKGPEKQSNAWPLQVQYHGPRANSPPKTSKKKQKLCWVDWLFLLVPSVLVTHSNQRSSTKLWWQLLQRTKCCGFYWRAFSVEAYYGYRQLSLL